MSPVEPAGSLPSATSHVRRRGAFGRLYRSEVRLILGRRRNQALLVALAVVPVLVGVAVKASAPEPGEGPAFLSDITSNGLFLVFTALTVCTPLFLPLVVGVVSGDSVAGEAGQGTLRYLLTVPVTRGRLLAVKGLGVATFAFVSVGTVALAGLVAGGLLFGLGDATLLSGDTVGVGEALLRAALVVAYLGLGLCGLAAGGLLVSTLTENALAAMAATVALSIASFVLDAVPQLRAVHPWLLTDHWLGFGELLRSSVSTSTLARWSGLHLAYVAVFTALAYARLRTRDVTS